MDAFFQPLLGVLIHLFIGVPAVRRIAFRIAVFADGRAAYLYPRFHRLNFGIYPAHDACDVVPPPLCQALPFPILAVCALVGEAFPLLGVPDVIEMDAVHIVSGYDFAHDVCQIFIRSGIARVQVPASLELPAERGVFAGQGVFPKHPYLAGVPDGDSHEPGMQFHAPPVAFFYGEFQWVVAGMLAFGTRQRFGERLECRGVDYVSPQAGLEKYRIEVGLFQLVKDMA